MNENIARNSDASAGRMNKRSFLKKLGVGAAAAFGAPYVMGASKKPIRWRLQTYASTALGAHVIKPAVDAFNKIAGSEMKIELYYADQLVPTSELFSALQQGTLDCVQSDDDSMGSPADVAPFSAYFPLATRYSLDVPALFNEFGLGKIWADSYNDVKNVTWLSSGSWDPCNFITKEPIRSLADIKGKKLYLARYFDAFYVKREYNWDFHRLAEFRARCVGLGKKTYILANSGCLNFCSARTFHDNLVAHQNEISAKDNAYQFSGICHEFLSDKSARASLLRRSNFIRPEDISAFGEFCDGAKLATRTNRNPSAVVEAYCRGRFCGNLWELTEPAHAAHFYPEILENGKIPSDYAERRLRCGKNCRNCGYCDSVQKSASGILNFL